MLLAKNAKDFIQTMLKNDGEIVIISKNRNEYIKALLLAEGLEEKDIEKIKIYDVNSINAPGFGNKGKIVEQHETKYGTADITVIADDNPSDFHQMTNSIKNETQKIYHQADTGQFEWKNITENMTREIDNLTKKASSENTAAPKSDASESVQIQTAEKKSLPSLKPEDKQHFRDINREEATKELDEMDPGNFIMRSSSRGPSYVAVSIKTSPQKVENYVYKVNDDGTVKIEGKIENSILDHIKKEIENIKIKEVLSPEDQNKFDPSMTTQTATSKLQNQQYPIGEFIIRPSSEKEASFTASVKMSETKVDHYQFQIKDNKLCSYPNNSELSSSVSDYIKKQVDLYSAIQTIKKNIQEKILVHDKPSNQDGKQKAINTLKDRIAEIDEAYKVGKIKNREDIKTFFDGALTKLATEAQKKHDKPIYSKFVHSFLHKTSKVDKEIQKVRSKMDGELEKDSPHFSPRKKSM